MAFCRIDCQHDPSEFRFGGALQVVAVRSIISLVSSSTAMHDNDAVTAARQTPPAVMSSRYPVDGIALCIRQSDCCSCSRPRPRLGPVNQLRRIKRWIRRFVAWISRQPWKRESEFCLPVDRPLVDFPRTAQPIQPKQVRLRYSCLGNLDRFCDVVCLRVAKRHASDG